MAIPKGFIESLGSDSGADDSAPDSEASESSMLEQHLSAFFRAGKTGDFATAADCFKAAVAAADEPEADDGESNDEEY
jgi:hypothetical protein